MCSEIYTVHRDLLVAREVLSVGNFPIPNAHENDLGDCWNVKSRHEYKPEFGVRIYPDDWKWDNHEKDYPWREHDGDDRGYWRKGVWIDF